MKNAKVSVIIPVYNGKKTLRQCLESVLNQTYGNYEVIVIDNNSTDKTKEIIKEFCKKNEKVKYVFEGYRSRGAARNKGISTAKGEIIAITDSDCIVPKNWVSEITGPIREEKEFIVQGNETDALGNYWTRMQQLFNHEFLKRHLYESRYVDHVDTKNFAIKKEILLKIGMFNRYIKNIEDFELKIRLKQGGYKNYFLSKLHVKHFHKDKLSSLFLQRMNQGYWATMVYFLHKKFFRTHPDEMVKSIHPFYFFIFFPWLLFFVRKGVSRAFFEAVTGIAWRIGIIYGLLNLRKLGVLLKPKIQ